MKEWKGKKGKESVKMGNPRFGGYGSFDEYFDKVEKVYVRNNTHPLGYVSLNFGDAQRPKYFTMPPTVLPLNLTDFFEKDVIRKSVEFRQLVFKGIMVLVNEKDYKAIVTPTMEDEVRDVVMGYDRTTVGRMEESVTGEKEVKSAVIQLIRMNTLSEEERKEVGDDVMSDDEIIAELSSMDLSNEDKTYIFTHAVGEVKKWITGLISTESGVDLGGEEDAQVASPSEPMDDFEKKLREVETKIVRKRTKRG